MNKMTLKHKSKNFLYISAFLKDSYISDGKIHPAFSLDSYDEEIRRFVLNLSKKTNYKSLADMKESMLSYKKKLFSKNETFSTEVRIVVECPDGWPPKRLEEIAEELWVKNPWNDILIELKVDKSDQMDQRFLEAEADIGFSYG